MTEPSHSYRRGRDKPCPGDREGRPYIIEVIPGLPATH